MTNLNLFQTLDPVEQERHRQIMIRGLNLVIDKHQAQARVLADAGKRKVSADLIDQAQGELEMAQVAARIRDQIKGV